MSQFSNEAAWQTAAGAKPFKLGPGPSPDPAENEVVIKVAYAAVNPVDWKLQDSPNFELPYPYIFGTDVAGTIVQLGSSVTRFQLGQRVIGHCDGLITQKKSNAGFQRYATTREILVSAIPANISLANAAVLPLSVSTAASALFHILDLPYPSVNPNPAPTGKRILIWGGSSSVGSSAVQLARAAGLEVVATAGRANIEYVKRLGASRVFDHQDPDVVGKILEVLKEGDYVFDTIGSESTQIASGGIFGKLGGGTLPITLSPIAGLPDNVKGVFVNGLAPGLVNLDVGDAVWRKYLPEALAAGSFQTKPDPIIIEGLERAQEGLDLLKEGVSAKKIVIEVAKE